MLISNITIENFRCYYGKNDLSFNKDGKITLIYGDSGFGKSSFLQFFKWMFYGLDSCDFGKHNDKPIFNETIFRETPVESRFKVFGQIDFEHLGVRYSLTKTLTFKACLTINACYPEKSETTLKTLVDNNWEIFVGDVASKINSILPKGLSKYFLLDGERARDIVLNSNDLKVAIHQLFGLDVYKNALDHIGNKNKKSSVLGYYNGQLVSKVSNVTTTNNMTPMEVQDSIYDIRDEIEAKKTRRREVIESIETKTIRREEIFKILGESNNKASIQQLITSNNNLIKSYEDNINNIKSKIGSLFYQNYPYLLLSQSASKSSSILREKNAIFSNVRKNVFEKLEKPLLKEIKEKNLCVCGRPLDEHSIEHIDNILAVMPPDSYSYQFAQFVARAKQMIQHSQTEVLKYDSLISEISFAQNKIAELENINQEKLEDLRRLDDSRSLVEELENLKLEIESLNKEKSFLEGQITLKKTIYERSQKMLENLMKNAQISNEYGDKIEAFEKVKKILEMEKISKENDVRTVLDKCVREVFKKLTTQTDLDADKIQFVNNDFSLRTTYLTGGQLAVDEYSYVIGIVKALQEFKMENNENPIIIDAPFAFTGNTQSEHIFKTLPLVSKQTVLLTLDLNKIKSLLNETDLYDFYVIKNDSQEKACIERGDINDFNFWY